MKACLHFGSERSSRKKFFHNEVEKKVGINRYVVYNSFEWEYADASQIEETCKHKNIILKNPPKGKPDVLIRKYTCHYPLSFHEYSISQMSIV